MCVQIHICLVHVWRTEDSLPHCFSLILLLCCKYQSCWPNPPGDSVHLTIGVLGLQLLLMHLSLHVGSGDLSSTHVVDYNVCNSSFRGVTHPLLVSSGTSYVCGAHTDVGKTLLHLKIKKSLRSTQARVCCPPALLMSAEYSGSLAVGQ